MKFAVLGLLVVVSLWSLFLGNKLREGIDLRGGHSLVFELNIADDDPEAKTAVDKTIATLKQRIDPQGLRSLEFRPMGLKRIEIRMPAGKQDSVDAKNAYDRAMDRLREGNLQRSSLQTLFSVSGQAQKDAITKLAGGNASLADRLDSLVKAHAMMDQAKSDTDRKLARLEYAQKEADVLSANVDPEFVDNVLKSFLSAGEKAAIKSTNDRDERVKSFNDQVKAMKDKYPSRVDQIEDVLNSYAKWAEVRQQLDDPSDLIRLVRKAGVLEFRIAPYAPESGQQDFRIAAGDRDRFVRMLQEGRTEGLEASGKHFKWYAIRGDRVGYGTLVVADHNGRSYVLLYDEPEFGLMHSTDAKAENWSLAGASPSSDSRGAPAIDFTFDAVGAKLFNRLTGTNISHSMAILLDDEVYSAPTIQSAISERGQITGRFTRAEVTDLVQTLRAGALRARLNPNPVAENTFGSGMGEDNKAQALKVAWWSLIAISVFMIGYYHIPGVVAVIAMVINTIFVLGAMSMMNAVFTLPGIAGIILGIGMAVDANVLIYERLREEQAKGQSIRMALKNAYDRAFSAIFDSNATTLLSCVILGWVGTEEVRGFAITLGLGVLFNLFTAVTVTRWMFQAMLETNIITKSLSMFHLIGHAKIDWMGKRYIFYGISIALGVLGVVSLFAQGHDIWGIEFSSGTRAVVKFNDVLLANPDKGGAKTLPSDGLVSKLFIDAAEQAKLEKLATTAQVATLHDAKRVDSFIAEYDKNGDKKITRDEWQDRPNKEYFEELDKVAKAGGVLTREVLEKHLPSAMYEVSTTESSVPKIRDVASKAFGLAMTQRQRVDFDLVKGGEDPRLKVALAEDGLTPVTDTMAEKVDLAYRNQFVNNIGGVLQVVKLSRPITAPELVQRVREIRSQPDFQQASVNVTDVIGLEGAGNNTFSTLAVLSRRPSETHVGDAQIWRMLASGESKVLTEALHREEAMTATNFDAAIAGETAQSAVMALILAWLGMIVYLWVRFGTAQWGLAAVICLVHDAIIMTGMVGLSKWLYTVLGGALMVEPFKMDLMMVTALLTMIGYSINDTIVVFDRIRENRGKLTTMTPSLINASINQTLSRTILTASTVVIVLLIMYIWGGKGIHPFSYALLIGVIEGTYSSIAVASPLLMGFKQALVSRVVGEPVTGK